MTPRCCVQWARLMEHNLNETSEMKTQNVPRRRESSGADAADARWKPPKRKYDLIECHIFRFVTGALVPWMSPWRGQGLTAAVKEQAGDSDRAGRALGLMLRPRGRRGGLQCSAGGEGQGDEVELSTCERRSEQECRDFRKFGIRGDVVFKTDQEPALVDLVDKICARRPSSRSWLTHSGVGDS